MQPCQAAGSGGKLTTKNMLVVKKAFCFSLNTKEVQIKPTCCGVEDKFNKVYQLQTTLIQASLADQ